ncbi:MAG: hypothetical protein ACREMI_06045 [Gemmatimonadales bacterium]
MTVGNIITGIAASSGCDIVGAGCRTSAGGAAVSVERSSPDWVKDVNALNWD